MLIFNLLVSSLISILLLVVLYLALIDVNIHAWLNSKALGLILIIIILTLLNFATWLRS